MDQFWTILNNSDSFEHIFSKPYCNMDPLRKNYTSVICHRYFASLVKKFEFSVPKWIETCRTGQMAKSVHEPKPAPNLGARPQKQAQMRSSSNFKSASCVNWSYTVSFLQVSAASGALVRIRCGRNPFLSMCEGGSILIFGFLLWGPRSQEHVYIILFISTFLII